MLVFDIETVPTLRSMQQPYPMADRQPPGNYSKPEAIAKWYEGDKAKWREDRSKECSLNSRLGRIVAIGYSFSVGEASVETAPTEDLEGGLLSLFWSLVKDQSVIAGFNSHSFDFPYILTRSLILGVQIPVEVPPYLRRYSYRPHFDVRMALTGWETRATGSLSDWCEAFGNDAPEGKGSEVYDAYLAGDFDSIVRHCKSDVRATSALVERVAPVFGL